MDEGIDLGRVVTKPARSVVVGTQNAAQQAMSGGRHCSTL
jgi:hypothetical protein